MLPQDRFEREASCRLRGKGEQRTLFLVFSRHFERLVFRPALVFLQPLGEGLHREPRLFFVRGPDELEPPVLIQRMSGTRRSVRRAGEPAQQLRGTWSEPILYGTVAV